VVAKRCRLSWRTKSALEYKPKCGGSCGVSANEYSCTLGSNKLWRSNSIFNLLSDRKFALMRRLGRAVSLPATGCDVEGKCRHSSSNHREGPRPLGLVFLFNLFFTSNLYSWASTFPRNLFCYLMTEKCFFFISFCSYFYLFFSSLLWSVGHYAGTCTYRTFSWGLSIIEFALFIFSNLPLY
jgi:hypothetical protein